MNQTTQISKATLDFFTAESLQIHALCDRALVPREIEGTALSMAQRVNVMEAVLSGLTAQIGQNPTTVLQ
jgi:hypothetical protein